MQLRLTIVSTAQHPTSRDVLVRAPKGSRLADIRDQLYSAIGVRGRLYVGAAVLSSETMLGVPPLLDGAIVTVGRPGPDPTPSSLLQLRVVGGPDAGHIVDLRPGALTIGRSSSAAIPLNDPDVSRTHAILDVTPDAVVVRDLDSTNGTTIDGRAFDNATQTLRPGELLRIGRSSLILVVPQESPAVTSSDGCGGIRISPAVRHHGSESPLEIELPLRPVPHQRSQLSLATALVPLVLAAGLLLIMRDPAMLWFLAFSPVAVIAHWAADRIASIRSDRRSIRTYISEHSAATSRLSDAIRAEGTTRRQAAPDPAAILSIASGPLTRIWERRPTDEDFLEVRVGTGQLRSRVTLVPNARVTTGSTRQSQPMVEDVPVCVNLRSAGVVGIAGPPPQQRALLRSVIGQLATLHSPEDLELIVCSESSEIWSWTAWLPHTSALITSTDEDALAPLVELKDQFGDRRPTRHEPGGSPEWHGRATVLILDDAHHWLRTPQLSGLSRDGLAPGVIVICLATEAALLPASCATTAVLNPVLGPILQIRTQGRPPLDKVVADLTGPWWAEQLAHRLAPLRLATSEDARMALPSSTRLLQLINLDPPTPDRLAAAWSSASGTRVVLGVTSNGLFEIDLVGDGPHILVAGTTGAGKSELLQTLVAALAIRNRPDQLTFLLVDYKGGAAFAECRSLPHVVGVVTDLDPALTERALRSLTGELRRRERILESTGSRDLEELQQRRGGLAGCTVPPRLVIVVDEFATLSEELPEFVTGLVGIAQRGRSLGVHLVLATQRPAGAVRADIKANATLRIALRVVDAAESMDIIDTSDAAMLPRQPGRAIARTGKATPVTFHTARISCLARAAGAAEVDVQPLPDCWSPLQRHDADAKETTQTDLAIMANAARDAAANLGIRTQPSPWHSPLPDSLSISDIPCEEAEGRSATALALGLTDYPDEQRQLPFSIDVAKGAHLVIAGGPRSGRSTVLHTLAGQVVRCLSPSQLHMYAIDNGDSLRALSALSQCGTVVRRHEATRGMRLLTRLLEEVDRRRERLSAGGFASVEEQRQFASAECPPWLLLLIDGWEAFLEEYEDLDYGKPVDDLLRLLREGPSAGVTVVITGGRAVLTGRVASVAARRLILRLPDRLDYGYAGVSPRQLPSHQPPGRGLLIDSAEPVETQIALLTSNPDGRTQSAALATLLEQTPAITTEAASPTIDPIRIAPLPAAVSFGALLREHIDGADRGGSLWAPLGVGGDESRLLGVDLDAIGPGILVAGPRRSGRSSVLLTLAKWYAASREVTVVAIASRGSPLAAAMLTNDGQGLLDRTRTAVHFQTSDQTSLLSGLIAGDQSLVVLVDDGDRLAEAPVDPLLAELLRSARPQTAVVIAGTTEDLASGYRNAVTEARRSRAGILLCPAGPLDGEIFRVRTARCERRPGRGLLVVDGVATPLQVADPR